MERDVPRGRELRVLRIALASARAAGLQHGQVWPHTWAAWAALSGGFAIPPGAEPGRVAARGSALPWALPAAPRGLSYGIYHLRVLAEHCGVPHSPEVRLGRVSSSVSLGVRPGRAVRGHQDTFPRAEKHMEPIVRF